MKKIITLLAAVSAAVLFLASCSREQSIEGHWNFKTLNGEEVSTTEKVPFLEFDQTEGTVHGCLGVNIVNGTYKFENGNLAIGNLGMTMMAGLPEDMEVEAALGEALKKVTRAKVSGNTLTLTDADGTVSITLGLGE